MEVNVEGVVVLVVFYLFVLVTGLLASWCHRRHHAGDGALETSLVAGRSLKGVVSVFTMMATTVGGGYINGTAESVATAGLVWTLAPFGIFLGLNIGGLVYARRMREKKYVTMLDPIQQTFGRVATVLVYFASFCGDVLWTAAILSALGSSLSVIAGVPMVTAVVMSSAVTVTYTLLGSMVAVAYTDVVQLCLIATGLDTGLGKGNKGDELLPMQWVPSLHVTDVVQGKGKSPYSLATVRRRSLQSTVEEHSNFFKGLSLPFVMTNENVANVGVESERWLGALEWNESICTWIDLLFAMSLGSIPWQAYFQRVLSVQRSSQAIVLSVVGAFGAVIFAVPSILIGAAAVSANWTDTSIGQSPLPPNGTEAALVLPLVLKEFTPSAVSVLGLGAISAAVMSSMDSAILGSSAMFTHNIYHRLFQLKASDRHLMVVQQVSVASIGLVATAISLSVPVIYGIFILAADIVYVIVLPQLTYAIFLGHRGSAFGAVAGFLVGAVMRLGAGEPTVGLQPFILFSAWDPHFGQSFPFRTAAMICSSLTIVLVSEIMRILRQRSSEYVDVRTKSPCQTASGCVVKSSARSQSELGEEKTEVPEQEMTLLGGVSGDDVIRN